MIPHGSRSLGYYAASHWLQSAVVLVLLGTMALFLLSAIMNVKEMAEKQEVELIIQNMRTGLQWAMAEVLMQQRGVDVIAWEDSNPVRWLSGAPRNYRGECSRGEVENLVAGEWCFEMEDRELVYRPVHAEHLVLVLPAEKAPCAALRWRVIRTRGGVSDGGFSGVRLEYASACRWVLEED